MIDIINASYSDLVIFYVIDFIGSALVIISEIELLQLFLILVKQFFWFNLLSISMPRYLKRLRTRIWIIHIINQQVTIEIAVSTVFWIYCVWTRIIRFPENCLLEKKEKHLKSIPPPFFGYSVIYRSVPSKKKKKKTNMADFCIFCIQIDSSIPGTIIFQLLD